MTIKLSDGKGFLEVVNKSMAEQLVNQAINEIEVNGTSTNQLIINKKCIANGDYLLEVGILKEEPTTCPSAKNFMKVDRNDSLLKAIDKLQLLVIN